MCLLAVLHHVCADAALVVGANREEFYARGGDPPRRLAGLDAASGVDPAQGGTWLGVNSRGVLVAVTNRRKTDPPQRPRSRGLLARDLLACRSASAAADLAVRELDTGGYAGCNYLLADGRDAVVVQAGDWLRVRPLPTGVHVLANGDVNDPADPRVAYAAWWLAGRPLGTAREALAALKGLCASHEPAATPICFRLPERGTVSSSLLALPARLEEGVYLHAQGPPDVAPYEDVSGLLKQLGGAR
jgi:uncharacterized protein with NRDE domain